MFVLSLVSCNNDSKKDQGGELSGSEKIKLKQYFVEGELLYQQHCSNCHQTEGEGLARLIPPLKNADYLANNIDNLPCIIRNGLQGEIMVNDTMYHQPMPANSRLTDLEIAEITTYVYKKFLNREILISPNRINKRLQSCSKP